MHAVRTEAGEVQVGTEECFRHLVEGLEDLEPKVRRLALCGLAASGDPRAPALIVPLLRDAHEEVRTRAAVALGKLGDCRVSPALGEVARGEDVALRRAAIVALGELDCGLDILSETMHAPEAADRVRAALALGETHDVNAVGPLTLALDDPDPTVRAQARAALERIRETPVF